MKSLPDVVGALNNEVTSLIGKKPAVAIKEKAVPSKPSTKYSKPVGLDEKKLPPLINVRYLYQPGELEGGTKRATDPIWSLKVYQVVENKTKPNEPVVYYLSDGLKRGCWLCRLIHSFRPPDVAVCLRLDVVICYPALCIKW